MPPNIESRAPRVAYRSALIEPRVSGNLAILLAPSSDDRTRIDVERDLIVADQSSRRQRPRITRAGVPTDSQMLVLSVYPEEEFAVRAFKVDAAGYLMKSSVADELLLVAEKLGISSSVEFAPYALQQGLVD